jgi:iron complex outermembrane receptor protein
MRTLLNRSIFSAAIISFFLASLAAAAEQTPTSEPLTEQQKLEEVKSYFESEYQEEDYFRTDRLLLTATGSLKPVYLAPSVATVITAEDIENMGAATLDEAIETVPGLHVYPNGTDLMEPNWSIRGIQSGLNPQVLLLLNGIPVTQTINGIRPYGLQMPVSMISRIEVLRGPGSAVYGADAFAGIINVITKDGQEVDGTEGGVRYGSFATSDVWLQHGGNYNDWDMVLGLDWQKTDGDDDRIVDQDGFATDPGPPPLVPGPPSLAPGPLDTQHESLDIFFGLRKDHWTFHAYSTLLEAGMGHGGAQLLSENSEIETNMIQGDITYDHENIVPDVDLILKGYTFYYDTNNYFDFYPSTYAGAYPDQYPYNLTNFHNWIGNPGTIEWNNGLEAVVIYKGFTDHRLRLAAGIDNKDDDTYQKKNFGAGIADPGGPLVDISDTVYAYCQDQNRTIWHVSAQDEWRLARRWELTAGVRYDHYSDFGGTINPRTALVWEARPDLTAKLLYGRAFRAPSFGEQHFKNNPLTIGNPDIEPETINTYELAFDYQPTSRLRAMVNLFYYDAEGLIEYEPITYMAQNYKDQEGHGLELEAVWQATDTFTLKGNIAYQHSEDKDTGEIVPEAPELQFYANAHWAFLPDWFLNAQYFWIGNRTREDIDPRPDIDDYSLVNLTLRRKNIFKNWDVAVLVRNLFDENVREPSPYVPPALPWNPGWYIPNDYPMETRAIFGEIRFHF